MSEWEYGGFPDDDEPVYEDGDFGRILKMVGVLGAASNVIPDEPARHDVGTRSVKIASHVVGGNWVAAITKFTSPNDLQPMPFSPTVPSPTHHWGVVVGDYFHELNADEKFNVVYQNGKLNSSSWTMYDVGETSYNDQAIMAAGKDVISKMTPSYNLLNNNCQLFVVNLVNVICKDTPKQVSASWDVVPWLTSRPMITARDVMAANTPQMKV